MWEMEELGRALGSGACGKQSKARHSHSARRDKGAPPLSVYRGKERKHVESGGACETEDKDEVFV